MGHGDSPCFYHLPYLASRRVMLTRIWIVEVVTVRFKGSNRVKAFVWAC